MQNSPIEKNKMNASQSSDSREDIGALCSENLVQHHLAAQEKDCGTPSQPDSKPLELVPANTLLSEAHEPCVPVVEGLFDKGDRVFIVGQSKARKSFFTLHLAIALATGLPFFGYKTKKQRVLLIDGEIGRIHLRIRLIAMNNTLNPDGVDEPALKELFFSFSYKDRSLEDILKLAEENEINTVILDPIYKFLGDESDQETVKVFLEECEKFQQKGITLIGVCHASKGHMGERQVIDRINGSGVFARDATSIISLCEHSNDNECAVISAVTRNYPPPSPFVARFENGAFSLAHDVAPIEKNRHTAKSKPLPPPEEMRKICEKKMPTEDLKKLIEKTFGIGRDKAEKAIANAVRSGAIEKKQNGRNVFYSPQPNVP